MYGKIDLTNWQATTLQGLQQESLGGLLQLRGVVLVHILVLHTFRMMIIIGSFT